MNLTDFVTPIVEAISRAINIQDVSGNLILNDPVIFEWVKIVYGSFRGHCKKRNFKLGDYLEMLQASQVMKLKNKPIHSITSVRYLGETNSLDSSSYKLDNNCLILNTYDDNSEIIISYNGGFDSTLDSFKEEPLFSAFIKQTIAWYKAKDIFGMKSVGIGDSTFTYMDNKLDLLTSVKTDLNDYIWEDV